MAALRLAVILLWLLILEYYTPTQNKFMQLLNPVVASSDRSSIFKCYASSILTANKRLIWQTGD